MKRFLIAAALQSALLGSVSAALTPFLTAPVASGPSFAFNYGVDLPGSERLDPVATNGITCRSSSSTIVQCAPAGTFFTIYDIPGFVSANVTAPGWSVTNQLVGKTPSSINGSFDNVTLTNITFSYTGAVISGPVTISGFQIISSDGGVNGTGHYSAQNTQNAGGSAGLTIQGVGSVSIPAPTSAELRLAPDSWAREFQERSEEILATTKLADESHAVFALWDKVRPAHRKRSLRT